MAQTAQTFDYHSFKEQQYDLLAAHVRQYINLDLLYQILQKND
jgi:adenosylcobyric acid synthase